MLIFFVLMVEVFMGYLLFWGQMFYWGVQVIILLFGVILVIGDDFMLWICGDYVIFGVILNCFFVLYVIVLLIVLLFLIVLYILVLYEVGLNNFDGIEIKLLKGLMGEGYELQFKFYEYYIKKYDIIDLILFYFYGMVKDLIGVVGFLFLFCYVLFFNLEMGGYFFELFNFEVVNLLKILEYIVFVWYFMLFYVILCVVLDKLLGVIVMGVLIVVLFLLFWLDCCKVCFYCYCSKFYLFNIVQFIVSFIVLGILGVLFVILIYILLVQIFSLCYFMFFVLLFFYSKNEVIKLLLIRVIYK